MAKVALPLVRHGELNPEEKTCFVLVYCRNQSAHKRNISHFTYKHLNYEMVTKKSVS